MITFISSIFCLIIYRYFYLVSILRSAFKQPFPSKLSFPRIFTNFHTRILYHSQQLLYHNRNNLSFYIFSPKQDPIRKFKIKKKSHSLKRHQSTRHNVRPLRIKSQKKKIPQIKQTRLKSPFQIKSTWISRQRVGHAINPPWEISRSRIDEEEQKKLKNEAKSWRK